MLKRILVLVFVISMHLQSLAIEGMWLPMLIGSNIEEMQQMGLQLSAKDLYNEDGTSLKDAIVRFGRGCTGAFISPEGLLITNHHCGLGQIQRHSSVENDYLTHGFWAEDQSQELPNPGLTITMLVRMEDVTDKIVPQIEANMTEQERAATVARLSRQIAREASEDNRYETQVAPFYYGNEYFLFVYEVYRDVRLVGAPPESIGSFGGDEDNWMWPRHTADFSLFRVYADADNKPADFNTDNKPYQPKHFFPVSNAGVRDNDFTMVYGFPGRTSQYLTADAVDFVINRQNPVAIDLRTRILDIYYQNMAASDQVRIQYTTKAARVSNAWKRWQGENRGLERLDAVNRKLEMEKEFAQWASLPQNAKGYGGLLQAFNEVYLELNPYSYATTLYNEAGRGVELIRFAQGFSELVQKSKDRNTEPEEINRLVERLKTQAEAFFKDYNPATDRRVFESLISQYAQLAEQPLVPPVLLQASRQFGNDFSKYAERVFSRSMLVSESKTMDLLNRYRPADYSKLEKDPAFELAIGLASFHTGQVRPVELSLNTRLDSLYRLYTAGLREMRPEQNFFPDANSTLRITYGKVEGSYPRDAVKYLYHSTANGILEKAANLQVPDYRIPERLEQLISERDFAPYDRDGELIVNFIGSNHTTGGNSGSPVVDHRGAFIGINFDRSWESTMSDIMFDPEQCRNITANSQYILWVIDRYAGMKYLLDEMTILNE
ncbi:MAG: S46 family peptidase [Bacteroidales bacterium]|nr:S46 family peptidase [Bacteroidales bacterium]